MDPITLGLTAASVGSSLFGLFSNRNQGRVNPALAWQQNQLQMQESNLEQARMNIDAQRRKRDIVRQAQVATANAENAAANSGAINSSGIEGARASISGQAGTNIQGVQINQDFGNRMFDLKRQQALVNYQIQGSQATRPNYGAAIGGILQDNTDELTRLMKWGWGSPNSPSLVTGGAGGLAVPTF